MKRIYIFPFLYPWKVIRYFYYKFYHSYKYHTVTYQWRMQNKHNFTFCDNLFSDPLFPIKKVHVGNFSYGPLRVFPYSKYDGDLRIGHFCSIAKDVCFLLGGEHIYTCLSTYPFKAKFKGEEEAVSKGDIIVEDDVWIGHSALIMSGITLARGSIVAAGSVVTKSTEPYSIVGGNPAKFIKKRFSNDVIENLMRINYADWDKAYIEKHWEDLFRIL